jgi:hypothetical protein
VTLSQNELPAHTHAMTLDPAGSHGHTGSVAAFNGWRKEITVYQYAAIMTQSEIVNYVGVNWASASPYDHTHSMSIDSVSNHNHAISAANAGAGAAFDNRPAYYAVAFIMKL